MAFSEGLAVLRAGQILGSDRWGGIFKGSCEYDAEAGVNRVHVRLEMPPGGVLITGLCAGAEGAALEISCAIERPAPSSNATVHLHGQVVAVELTYIGPLPA
ncbi:MAG: hypothetical protein WC807_02655 [Hyphomicrobium sp.]